jgi:hypothetical protein
MGSTLRLRPFVSCNFRDTKTISWGLTGGILSEISSWASGAVTGQWRELSSPDVIDQTSKSAACCGLLVSRMFPRIRAVCYVCSAIRCTDRSRLQLARNERLTMGNRKRRVSDGTQSSGGDSVYVPGRYWRLMPCPEKRDLTPKVRSVFRSGIQSPHRSPFSESRPTDSLTRRRGNMGFRRGISR